jgi:hypothetical protein
MQQGFVRYMIARVSPKSSWVVELIWTYDHENQLTRVQTDDYYTPEASRWKVEFVYDGQGRLRIKKDYVWYSGYGWYPTGETRYLYDGLLLVQERSSANTPTVTYTRGRDLSGSLAGAGGIGGLLARSHGYSGGNWSCHNAYHADGHGNVTALADGAGGRPPRSNLSRRSANRRRAVPRKAPARVPPPACGP